MSEVRVLVGARDYDASTRFYRDLLGLPVQEEWHAPDGRGTLFSVGAAVIEVIESSPHHPAEEPRGVAVAIEVEDADALHQRVAAAGVTPTESLGDRPWGHRSFQIRDPAGLALTFFQVLPAPAPAR
ncbi:MAG TPA: VOC family protein [Gaiellaceae bacterium]|nr:VOC family protein [Gaiellaceae bacterium]